MKKNINAIIRDSTEKLAEKCKTLYLLCSYKSVSTKLFVDSEKSRICENLCVENLVHFALIRMTYKSSDASWIFNTNYSKLRLVFYDAKNFTMQNRNLSLKPFNFQSIPL